MIPNIPTTRLRLKKCLGFWCALAVAALPVQAHDPFDATTRMMVYPDRMEMTVTMGSDAARQLLTASGLSPREVASMTRGIGPITDIDKPASLASHLFEVNLGAKRLEAKSVRVLSADLEIVFTAVYPRPASEALQVRAAYFRHVPEVRNGLIVAGDPQGMLLGTAMLSREKDSLQIPLLSAEPAASAADTAGKGASPH